MKYFKNTELASLYHISEKSVRNWIDSTQKGKLDLELHEVGDRFYVANTTKNATRIKELVNQRKKFTNSRGHKIVRPKPEFYELYTDEQILNIMSRIDTHKEIPLEYSYFNGGVVLWQNYVQKLLKEDAPNMLTSTIKLLDINKNYVDGLIEGKKVNVIDLGVGDASPSRKFLEHLHAKHQINRYIGIDFSREMLAAAEANVAEWLNDEIRFESYPRNLNYDRFEDILQEDLFEASNKSPVNLVLLFGGTLTNCKDPDLALQIIAASMNKDDYLIYALKLDTESSRRYFDFQLEPNQLLTPRHALVLDLLNIDQSLYDVEQFFDPEKKARFIQIRLKVDLSIAFDIKRSKKQLHLRKGEAVVLWRYWHQSATDVIAQFDRKGFELLQASLTGNQEYLLTISKVRV